jgi:hypothetical protein
MGREAPGGRPTAKFDSPLFYSHEKSNNTLLYSVGDGQRLPTALKYQCFVEISKLYFSLSRVRATLAVSG